MPDPLAGFCAPTRAWFAQTFAQPTPAQQGAWAATLAGDSVLVSAPTGSGKTLAAFLAAIDGLLQPRALDPSGHPPAAPTGVRVLYVSPLKALAYDVDRNLRAPLAGITHAAARLGQPTLAISVGMRTGDTSQEERRRLARTPPDVLITTPESLFLLLTSQARAMLTTVETVIVDEVHAVAGTKRGAHLALSLERLEALAAPAGGALQRIGLSATQRPLDEVARFLGGGTVAPDGTWTARPVTVVEAAGADKTLDVEIVVPVQDMSRLGEVLEEPVTGPAAGGGEYRRSIWPAVHPRVLDLVLAHRSTIVFANSRRLAERLCARLNELHRERVLAQRTQEGGDQDVRLAADGDREGEVAPIAMAHHGSVAREQRVQVEEALKSGALRCVVATSSLELGIDMGAVDLVIQVESPGSVAAGLQRIGRAGHQVGAPSVGKVFPKFRGDLVECAVVVRRMHAGAVEETRYPRNPLDVLAQQVVAVAALDRIAVDDLLGLVRGAANFAEISRTQLDGVLDMLSGRYPSDEFAELRPRIIWDRVEDVISGRPGAQRLAVTSGGTIPDRGLYGVFVAGEGAGRRVGELDEEMVYETRPGEHFTLGSSTWRIEHITRDQVIVTPAPGQVGKVPFWHGDAPARPVEVGRAVGAFLRELGELDVTAAAGLLRTEFDLDEWAAANLAAYLDEQRQAAGVVPSDRTIVVERFRDEIGDWRVCVLSPFGRRVHAPWALAIRARARERLGIDVQTIENDDGIVVRLPDTFDGLGSSGSDGEPTGWAGQSDAGLDAAMGILVDPDDIEELVVGELADSPLYAARFRECAARALLLPRRAGGGGGGSGGFRRTPLWQQRQRAADLLAVASRYGSFPIVLETYRECLRDVFDVPGLRSLLADIAARRIRVVHVETPVASPFAASLLFDYIAGYLYEGDAPLAERRAQALSLDRELLAELLGAEELRELVDPDALDQLELEVQRLAPGRRAHDVDGVHDLLREVGDLRDDEVAARTAGPAAVWLAELALARRASRVRVAGEERWGAAEDAARFRDGLGAPPQPGLPEAFLQPVDRPLADLVARYARTHGPFTPAAVADRLGLPLGAVDMVLVELAREGRVASGEFRPGGRGQEWCDAEVLRRLRRRSLAVLRREVEPVEPRALARFLPAWQQVGARLRGIEGTMEVVLALQGAPLPASVLEREILAARLADYQPAWLDALCGSGEVVWVGRGPLGARDGRVALYLRDQAPALAPLPMTAATGVAVADGAAQAAVEGDVSWLLLAQLAERGASFWPALYAAAGGGDEAEVVEALWDLVWAGLVTNDTIAPLRAAVGNAARRGGAGRGRAGRPGRALTRGGPPQTAGRWSLVADQVGPPASATARAAALAAQLLDRHGVVVRDIAQAEDVPGGFSAVYPVLKAMEESGRARRGYFVDGLGGAQFALPGAVDRLRALRQDGDHGQVVVLAATDPANPYGAALGWPQSAVGGHSARRVAGALVVLVAGALTLYVERGGRSLSTYGAAADELAAATSALADTVRAGRGGRLVIQRIDGTAAADQPVVAALRAAGFSDHPRGLVMRPGDRR